MQGRSRVRIFGELKLRDYAPDLITYATMVDVLCRIDGIVDARNLWMEMVAKEIKASDHDTVKGCTTRCGEGDSPMAQMKSEAVGHIHYIIHLLGNHSGSCSSGPMFLGLIIHRRSDSLQPVMNSLLQLKQIPQRWTRSKNPSHHLTHGYISLSANATWLLVGPWTNFFRETWT
ncbi:hypothetical protein OPV22_011714 [Ensete ventricosum]|uniref:Pentatricopeptide repeat-containing protein n=1 Tax=Ensete ventricosum TaxID=4639 RepID=A0AAV8RJQ6_ENSVE|nr:hypothetical protein OPV22_011714 [Ensete ventricosum]